MGEVINYLGYLAANFYDSTSNTVTLRNKHDCYVIIKLLEWKLNDPRFKIAKPDKKAMIKKINQLKRIGDKNV